MIKLCIKLLLFFLKTNQKSIIYHSFPDVSDNSFSLFCYIINNNDTYKNIWLVDTISEKEKYIQLIHNYTKSDNFSIIKKNSFLGIYHYCKSKYIFHTHGFYNNVPLSKKQVNVNLWHGMPLKNIGFLDTNKIVPKSNYVIATSKLFKKIMSQAFDIKESKVIVSGQPRNDLLFSKKFSLLDVIDIPLTSFKKTILWMPTYRKSNIGDVRTDGKVNKMNDFLEKSYLSKLNVFLSEISTVCFIKLHPMDYMNVEDFEKYSHIHFIDNSNFINKGISLYSILNSTDLLLTDFSSIYIDYLLLNKPIGFVFSDYDAYFNSRGFVFENPKEYMPGEVITARNNLIPFLEDVFTKKKDSYIEKRNEINTKFNEQKSDFSKKIVEFLLEKEI